MHEVHLVQLILSIAVAIVLLVVGISGLVKKNVQVVNASANQVMISEWVAISLGGLLLILSIWSYVICAEEDY